MSANNFLFDTRDLKFIFKEWLDTEKLLGFETYRDDYTKEDIDSYIDVTYKICRDVLGPANEEADKIGVQFIEGKVVTPPSFKKAHRVVMEAGLGPQVADREMPGRMPLCMNALLQEMMIAASAGILSCWGLTAGAAGVIQKYASQELKAKFLPKMFTGEWGGTMNLTEPGAGSDVGAVATRAYPTDTPGVYKIKGSKLFISAGDHDLASNIIHLVLARPEGSKQGTAGLSLFIVPKYRINEDGSIGSNNDVATAGIEHKMGLKGSPTCSLVYGENDDCFGYLIGDPPREDGKGQGIAQMFDMMNEARLGTGVLSLAVTAEAYYNALAYSKERVQGTKLTNPKGPRVKIIEHEDVRRMLLLQKSCVEAVRALIMKTYYYIDLTHDSPDQEEREFADHLLQISTPLCKAYASDLAWPLIGEAIQTYGGYGYIEEYPVAQLARDCKVFSIWEGTNYIQSMDLIGRKFTMNKGKSLKSLLKEIGGFIQANQKIKHFEREIKLLGEAMVDFQGILALLKGYMEAGKISIMPLYATRVLHATAMLYCGMLIMDQALVANQKLNELDGDHYDVNFYKGKIASARFYVANVLPQIFSIKKIFEIGDTTAIDIALETLG